MFDKELCKKCCHWYDSGNYCNSTRQFCVNNDHFSPKKTFSITELMLKPKIENVIFNDPATIVFWDDGSKTVVKCHDSIFDPEKGLAIAISKKALGNKYDYYEEFGKWLPKKKEFDGVESALRRLSDALHSTDLSGCIPKRIFPAEMCKQPCKDCLNDMTRPGFKKVTEEIDDRLCSKCVHKGLKYTEEPCTSCFYDYTRPNFEKVEDK